MNLDHDQVSPNSSKVSKTVLVWLVFLKKSAFISPVHKRQSDSFFLITSFILPSVSEEGVTTRPAQCEGEDEEGEGPRIRAYAST